MEGTENLPNKNTVRDFNKVASSWDEKPRRVELAAAVAGAMKENLSLTGEIDALEFGCGTGLVTFNLAQKLHQITVMDNADEMLAVVEQKAEQFGVANVFVRHSRSEVPELPEGQYDLVFSSMVLHHLANIAQVLTVLVAALKPGGVIALADLDVEDGSFHSDHCGVEHHGIDRAWLIDTLRKLGLSQVGETTAHVIVKNRPEGKQCYPVFLVWAQKPL